MTLRIALFFAATLAAGDLLAQPSDPTLAAIVRLDGVVLPFARFDGRNWAPFPAARGDSVAEPPQRDQMPNVWRIHPADGSTPRSVAGGSTVLFNTEGENWYDTWGQVTDYSPRRLGPKGFPSGRLGMALSGTLRRTGAATFAEHGVQSAMWRQIRSTVARAFGRAETRTLSQRPIPANVADWPRGPMPDSAYRATRSISLQSLYVTRARVSGARLYYVEARKVYPARAVDATCPPAVYYQAWFRQSAAAAAPVLVAEQVTPGFACDSPGAAPSRNVPFGAFVIGGRTLIPVEQIDYESGERRLFEVTRTSVRSAYPGPR